MSRADKVESRPDKMITYGLPYSMKIHTSRSKTDLLRRLKLTVAQLKPIDGWQIKFVFSFSL